MTAKIESNFGREIKKNIEAFWFRIENRHGGGIPDIYGIRDGVSIWLELKCINNLPKWSVKGLDKSLDTTLEIAVGELVEDRIEKGQYTK